MKKAGRKEKVILMTGDPSDSRLREPDMPHVVTNLYKPFRIDSFLHVVNAAIKNTKRLKKEKRDNGY